MKICLIYSGNARTVADTYENHRWFLRVLRPATIYVSIADDPQADDMLLLKQAFPLAEFHMEKVVQPQIPEPVQRTKFLSGYPPSSSPQAILRQLWGLNRAWEFVCEKGGDEQHDLFVRVRPDIAFCRTRFRWQDYRPELNLTLRETLSYDLRRNIGCDIEKWACCPRWSKWGGQNDRFAVLGLHAAESYFTTFQKKLWDQGAPLHPETLIDTSMEQDGIVPDDTGKFEFKTTRLPTEEHPRGGWEPIEISAVDVMDQIR